MAKQLSQTLKALWRATFWVSFPFGILSFVLPIYGKDLGATALEIGGFFSAMSLMPVVVRPFLGRALDRWGQRASALIPNLRSIVPLIALWAVESLGYTASVPAERAFVADIAGQDTRGTSYGLYTFAHFLGSALGPLAGGWLYNNLGHAMPFYLNTPPSCSWARCWWRGCCGNQGIRTRLRRIRGFPLSSSHLIRKPCRSVVLSNRR